MRAAFPRPDYYGPSAPRPGYQRTTRLPAASRPAGRNEAGTRGGSHVHHLSITGLGPQLCPSGIAMVTPQSFSMASRPGLGNPAREFPARHEGRLRTAPQPVSTGFELVRLLRSFRTLVPVVDLPALLAGPAPSGSTGASRRCQGCSRPPRRLPVQAALSFATLLRQHSGGGLSPPLE